MEKIIVIVEPDGTTTVEGTGFSGPACDAKLRKLADALGVVDEVVKKPEFFTTGAQANRRTA